MIKGKMLHFVAFFVHFDKLIRPHPGPLWGGSAGKKTLMFLQKVFLLLQKPYKIILGPPKWSHRLKKKKNGILWGKNSPSPFYEVLFFFSTKVCVCCDFRDERMRMLWFLRQKCILCDFCNKNARMLWLGGSEGFVSKDTKNTWIAFWIFLLYTNKCKSWMSIFSICQ